MSHTTTGSSVRFRKTGIAALALLIAAIPVATADARPRGLVQNVAMIQGDAASIGDRVVEFARQNQGRAIGDGECYDLADQALRRAGARSAPSYGEITADGDYVWGRQVDVRDAQPGDIVQFRDFTVKTTVLSNEILPNGRSAQYQRWETDIREHHTAIVERNLGGRLVLLEQNVEPGLVVQRTIVPVASMTVDGSPDAAPGVSQTTYEVAGMARVYRPQLAR